MIRKSLKSMTLRDMPCNIISIATEQSKTKYQKMAQKLYAQCQNMGRGSAFERRQRLLRNAADNGLDIRTVMDSDAFLRPLFDLWKTDSDFLQDVPPTADLVTHIDSLVQQTPNKRLTRQPLRELCMLFYSLYDSLPNFALIGDFLCRQLDRYNEKELMFGLDKLHRYCRQMLTPQGHRFLATLPKLWSCTLIEAATYFGIPKYDSQLFNRSVQVHYIERLKALPANAEDPLLNEVCERTLYNQYMDRPRRFGHNVLEVLIDTLRAAGQKPGQLWLDTLLSIGGDPRLPPEARSFRTWWRHLKKEHLQCMYEWLSEQDLELFLKICREYSIQSSQEAMRRMYPDRENFLRGLFKKKLIRQTRLYLGGAVQAWVDRTFQAREKPMTTKITGNSELAVFYLSLTSTSHDTVHMVEGTHNFTVSILDQIPPQSVFASWQDQVPARCLSKGLEEDYRQAFPASRHLYRFRHNANGRWKLEAVQALRDLGVNIVEFDVMSKQDYNRIRGY